MEATFESIAWLKQRLGDGCEEVLVQGDRPLLLDDPSCAYLTLSEHHQVFCVGYEGGHAAGRREHMAVCGPGQLLFGLQPAEGAAATALILSGVSGSVVWRMPTAVLFRLASEQQGLAVIAKLFDTWIGLLMATLPGVPIPTRTLALRGGETVETDGSVPLKAESGLVWVSPRTAPSSFFGIDPRSVGASADCWPLSHDVWAHFAGEQFKVWQSGELLRATGGASFADGFYRFVVHVVSRRRAELANLRLSRDSLSRSAEQTLLAESLAHLATVGRGERLAAESGGANDFERATRLITRWLGVDAPRIVRPEGQTFSDMQLALSRTTGIRTRDVLLSRGWQRHNSGPLLAFAMAQGDELIPVALLPSGGGYVLHDPRSPTARTVDEDIAGELHPHAHQVYAPLPSRPLAPLDVLRFSSTRALRDIAFVVVVGTAMGSLGTLVPLLTGQIFDRIIPGAERGLLRELTLVLLAVFAGQLLFDLARGLALVRAQTLMDTRLEAGVWDRLLRLPLPFFRRYSAGELATRAHGIAGIREVLAGATLSAMLSGVFSIWNFALLFYIDQKLSLAASGLVVVAGSVAAVAAYYGLQRQRTVAEIDGKIGGLLLQLLTGIAKLRITGTENRAFGIWSSLFARRRDADLGAERVNIRVAVFQSSYPIVCSIALFWLLAGGATTKLSTGQFLAFSAAFSMFLGAMLNFIETGLHVLSVIPMYERAKPILTAPVESQGSGDVRIQLEGALEVSHVSFRYEQYGPLILDDVNLRIRPGEFVAIVGASGSGKSSLLRILLGFEECTEGGVFFDGQALAGLDLRVLRQQIGVVLQNSRVTAGDVHSNIVGNSGRSVGDAWHAARSAAIDKDIEAMPMGMHTVISQGGATLSGGQKQRLLIARALAARPAILFFDEATSALDNVTQAAVSESLEKLRVTRVVIAHRLSTIRHADQIVVLERGRVVQVGRFEELMQQEGPFHALAKRQTV